jgi:hypothetical protein
VVVTATTWTTPGVAQEVFAQMRGRDFPRLAGVYADGKYHNYDLEDWLSLHRRPYRLEVVSRPAAGAEVQAAAGAVDGGADIHLAGPLPVAEQGL